VGVLSRVIDAGHDYRNTLDEVEGGLFVGTGARSAKLTQFWVLLVLASLIAAGGVVGDSTPAVIGAMIIAPLATPIYGVALASVVGSRRHLRDALLLLVSGIVVNILLGMLVALVTFERVPLDANPQITGRTAPTVLDLGIAVAVGVAGCFALVRRDIVNILAGVAIAISLVPVLAVVGITLGSGRLDLAWGATILFLTNAAAIIVAGVVVFTAAGYQRDAAARGARAGRRAKVLIAVFILVLVIPLTVASVRTYRYESWVNATEAAAERWVVGTDWRVTGVHAVGGDIVASVIGAGEPPPIETLRAEVRRSVPAAVAVRVVEDSGKTVEL
jgi:uncharacterized hydrophobic protein (TIGR00271 family)